MSDVSQLGVRRLVRFEPVRRDDLRPDVLPWIGETFEVLYAGTHGDDEPYPGESIWTPTDWTIANGRWFPDRDLVDVDNDKDPAQPSEED